MQLLLKLQAGLSRRLGRPAAAARLYRQTLVAEPGNPKLLGRLGQSLAEAGDPQGALAAFRQLAEVAPRSAGAHYNIGFLLDATGDLDGALESFDRAIEADSQMDRAWFGRGTVLEKRGRTGEAIAAYQKVVVADPAAASAWLRLGELHLIREEFDELDRVINHLRGLHPQHAWQLMQGLAALRAKAADQEKATGEPKPTGG